MDTLPSRSWIEIDLGALEENVRKIKARLPDGVKYIAVVKADAYGHCMPQTLLAFIRGGADMFAVANMYEVSRIRELVSSTPVLVLSPILSGERRLVFEYDAIPALSTREEAQAFDSLAAARGKILDVHVKIDTGMGRYGIRHGDAPEFLRFVRTLKNLRLAGVFTHFSSADSDEDYTKIQAQNFARAVEEIDASEVMIHMHNSAGLKYFENGVRCGGIRCGLLQYGISPFDESEKPFADVEPVLSFKARISAVAKHDGMRVACVSAGYADGVPSGFTEASRVLVGGVSCPVLGNAGLDETFVDVSAAGDVREGDEVVFIGRQGAGFIDLPSYSHWTRRIPWETMVSIPRRVERLIKTR